MPHLLRDDCSWKSLVRSRGRCWCVPHAMASSIGTSGGNVAHHAVVPAQRPSSRPHTVHHVQQRPPYYGCGMVAGQVAAQPSMAEDVARHTGAQHGHCTIASSTDQCLQQRSHSVICPDALICAGWSSHTTAAADGASAACAGHGGWLGPGAAPRPEPRVLMPASGTQGGSSPP